MKKLLMVVAVLATSSLALAAPSFTLPAEIDLIAGGVPVDVLVGVTNLADANTGLGIQGMNLYLGTDAPLVLSNLQITNVGLFTSANSTLPNIFALDDQTVNGGVTTTSGYIVATGNVAKVTIMAPASTALGTYSLSTLLGAAWDNTPSDFAGIEAGQATAVVKVTPEPTSLLLLIAGLPLLRRRHA